MKRKIAAYIFLIMFGLGMVRAQPAENVYLIPIEGEINDAVATYVRQSVKKAEDAGASKIIFEVDTYGGIVLSAIDISNAIMETPIPTVCYIKDNAISAGVIISISGNTVVANNSINIGSAETIPNNEKYLSTWVGKLKTVAERKERNADIIAGMADVDIEIEGIKDKGKLLNLTAVQALEYGIVDEVVDGKRGLYEFLGISHTDVTELQYDYKTNIARFTNNTTISTILITLGIIGIIGEIFTAGFGVFGSIGILSFALFFAGRVIAGHAGIGVLILFAAGLVLLGIEITIPGFGVPGITGIACVILSIIMGSANPISAAIALSLAIILSVVILIVLFKFAPKNKLLDRLILSHEGKTDKGYTSYTSDREGLIDEVGEALTQLRPSGTMLLGDKRIDVVSEGGYIEKGAKIQIIAVEGSRMVVRRIVD